MLTIRTERLPEPPPPITIVDRSCRLDREADALLAFGNWRRAELLANRAQLLREVAP